MITYRQWSQISNAPQLTKDEFNLIVQAVSPDPNQLSILIGNSWYSRDVFTSCQDALNDKFATLAPNLVIIELESCYLTSLPDELNLLKKLKKLKLSCNRITQLPASIGFTLKTSFLILQAPCLA